MQDSNPNKITLKVAEAQTQDVGRGLARLDPAAAEVLDVGAGDALLIEGRRTTAALVWPGLPQDRDTGLVRLDPLVRRNGGVGLDDTVTLRKGQARPAARIVLAPTEPLQLQGAEAYLARLLEGRVVTKGDLIEVNLLGQRLDLVVTGLRPGAEALLVGAGTRLELSDKVAQPPRADLPRVSYEDIGGMKQTVERVREMVELPLRHPEVFDRLGIEAPKGVLLYGPPGTGKTLLARAVANETSANFFSLSGSEVMSKYYGQSEENLREIFNQAEAEAPSILFIDEVDALAPKRSETTGEVEHRLVAQLLASLDGLRSRGKVVVMAATNRPEALDEALRRPGRFDRELEVTVPDQRGRHEILQIHTRGMPLAPEVDLARLAEATHGYTGADIAALVKEAGLHALRRALPELGLTDAEGGPQLAPEALEQLEVTAQDFDWGLAETSPSIMREVLLESPNVAWADIGGLADTKQTLQQMVEWPLRYPAEIDHFGARVPKGVLLYGPPGTGKTLLAKAVATEAEANFISVRGPELLSKWVGESERGIRKVFARARQAAPCVIFFDELEALAPSRGHSPDSGVSDRVLSQLLTELDGLAPRQGVTVLAATNRPDLLDRALLRPGRFDKLLEVELPDREARLEILKVHTREAPLAKEVDLPQLAGRTEGFSGADLEGLCGEATMLALEEYLAAGSRGSAPELEQAQVRARHFQAALIVAKGKSAAEPAEAEAANLEVEPAPIEADQTNAKDWEPLGFDSEATPEGAGVAA